MCVSRSGVFYFAQIAGRLGGDSPLWRPVSTQTSAGRRCAPASCAAMITCANSACDTASTARRRLCTTVSRPGAIQAMPGRPGILSAFAHAATMRCTTATASSSRRWVSSGDSAPNAASPPTFGPDWPVSKDRDRPLSPTAPSFRRGGIAREQVNRAHAREPWRRHFCCPAIFAQKRINPGQKRGRNRVQIGHKRSVRHE